MKEKVYISLKIIFVQICGSLFGIFMTFVIQDYNSDGTLAARTPIPPIMCPRFTNDLCLQKNVGFKAFVVELVSSFVLVLTWLYIRDFELDKKL